MGGFTQPRHLAFLNPLDKTRKEKDSYEVRVGPNRISPSTTAYSPHVVYLATTLYPIRWGHGRATRREVFSGFCAENELSSTMEMLNGNWIRNDGTVFLDSTTGEYLEKAVWPGSPQARSLENKYKKATAKLQLGPSSTGKKELIQFDISPPVLNWIRPEPPYNSPRLIVPLLTITLPSRPLAATLARLCQSFERGLPFYASVPDLDRKDGPGFFRRLLRMRMDRIKSLTEQIVEKLDGEGGGFFGLRLKAEDKGRGVEGEMLYENLVVPEKGWAQLRWLEQSAKAWEGLPRESLMESWAEERVGRGESWNELGEAKDVVAVGLKQVANSRNLKDLTEADLKNLKEGQLRI